MTRVAERLRRMMAGTSLLQVAIVVLGGASVHVLGLPGWEWLGYCLAVLAQPFWLLDSYRREQWGIFWVSMFYTWQWLQGAVAHFPDQLWQRVMYG